MVAVGLVVALLPLPAQAGTQDNPEIIDPEGDQETEAGTLAVQPQSFDDIDIVAAWVAEDAVDAVGEAGPIFELSIQTVADIQEDATFTASFRVTPGPTSEFGSTATDTSFTINWADGAATGVDGVAGAIAANVLQLDIPRDNVGAVGGDLLLDLTVTSLRNDAGTVMPPVTQDDESGTDTAGPGTNYTFLREPPVLEAELEITGGYFVAEGARQDFTGNEVTVEDRDQGIEVDVRLTNTGSDAQGFGIQEFTEGLRSLRDTEPEPGDGEDSSDIDSPFIVTVQLDPGESYTDTWTIQLDGSGDNASLRLSVGVEQGRFIEATLDIVVDVPAAAAGRAVYPAGLGFMTPAAEATGLDDEFGDYAELFLLALLLLLFFILVFLLLVLRRPLPIAVAHAAPPIEPAKAFASHVTGEPASPTVAAVPGPAPTALATGGALGDQPDGIELGVLHTPAEPDLGDKVTTTAIVRNMRKELRKLRVALLVDGKRKVEEEIELMPRGTREVRLPWLAGPGKNVASVEVTES